VSSANSRGLVLLRHSGKSLMYNRNSNGPKIEPWGTPHLINCSDETDLFIWHFWRWFERYDFSKLTANCPFTPYHSYFLSRMLWSTVSNAFFGLWKPLS
jgi:hypothetical protein